MPLNIELYRIFQHSNILSDFIFYLLSFFSFLVCIQHHWNIPLCGSLPCVLSITPERIGVFLTKCGSSYPSFNRSMFPHLYTPIHEIWNIKYSNNLFYRLAYLYIYLFIILGVGALVSQSDIRSCAPKKEKKSMFAVTRPFLRKVTENKPFFRKNLQKFIETLFLKLLYFCK